MRAEEKDIIPEDTYRHKGMRKDLVDSLRQKGITDETVLTAMNEVPRHFFFPTDLDQKAYQDVAFPISAGQTISQPYTVAFQTQLLEVKAGDKVLEVGTGSAYQASVLAQMGATVFTIERQRELFKETTNFVLRKKYPPSKLRFVFGDGFEGLPLQAPFEKIIITCGAPFIPPKLIEQLNVGGILVIPVLEDQHHRMLRVIKKEDGTLKEEAFSNFSFVPMLPGTNQ
jgi:protein-L-isoaspartate(D-aspartate) O-methyltransferase